MRKIIFATLFFIACGGSPTGPERFRGYDHIEFAWQSATLVVANAMGRVGMRPSDGCQFGHWGSGIWLNEESQRYNIGDLNDFITADTGSVALVCRDGGEQFKCFGIMPACPYVCDTCRPCENCQPRVSIHVPAPVPSCGSCGTVTPPPAPIPPVVEPVCAPVVIDWSPKTATVQVGQSITFTYSAPNADVCHIGWEGGTTSPSGLPPSGSYAVSFPYVGNKSTVSFTCTCAKGGSSSIDQKFSEVQVLP